MPVYTYKDIPKILTQAEKGQPANIYLIAGDSYLVNDVHHKLIDRLIPEESRPFNLEIADGEKEDIRSILERLQTFPFFPGPKVVSVKNPVQIFSSGGGDRLLKKAEEAWQKGQPERCTRILRALFQNVGISMNSLEGGESKNEEILMEKLFPDKEGPLPNWCKEALIHMQDQSTEESPTLNPEQLLDSAIRQGFPKDHLLILLMEGPSGSKKIVKTIAEYGVVLNLSLKQGKKGEQTATLKGFMKTRLAQEGKTIIPQAEALLLERVGPETYLLEMEIQKLVAYTGDRKQILPKDITEIVGAFREEPLYELTSVLGERKLEEGLQKLGQLWEQGYNPLQILAGITNALRRLLAARELLGTVSEAPDRIWQDFGAFSAKILPQLKQAPLPEFLSRVHPFVLYNTMKTSRNFSLTQLVSALAALHQTDRLLKTSGATPAFLLEDFIISFCK
ncbi:MAG: DNA polymerase III subunit delta [Deltaproteobacteria bacterium RBG_13_43_22]|nr:MAG: DNA polymerase III subunit delta [Deltaproteobacteria bacterium RBG_13_43_22]